MIRDVTLEAVERLLAAALPSDVVKEVYLSTQRRGHSMDFDYAEIIADPYTVEVSDMDGIPSMASCIAYINYVAPDGDAAERFLSTLCGFAFALTPSVAMNLIETLPEPFNRLRVIKVEPSCNGFDPQEDGTVLAQFQFTLSLRPIIIEQP